MSCLRSFVSIVVMAFSAVLLVACGGGDGGDAPQSGGGAVQTYTLGGNVTALGASKSLVLTNGSGVTQTISANGSYTYAGTVNEGGSYNIAVLTQPEGQFCRVTNGSGVVSGANITNVAVSCLNRMGGSLQTGQTLNPIGAVTTLAGTSASADGIGSAANFGVGGHAEYVGGYLYSTVSDNTNIIGGHSVYVGGDLYVTDTDNHTIRKITVSSGQVTTFAGVAGMAGAVDGIGVAARFNNPTGITSDGASLYVVDSESHTIRKIAISNGNVTTLAGLAGVAGGGDNAVGADARFNKPVGIVREGANLYVADADNHTIRKIVISTSEVTTLAGTAGEAGAVDNTGASARFQKPTGIASDGTNLYVVDSDNHLVRKVVINTGAVTTLAGSAGNAGTVDATGPAARFDFPADASVVGADLYVTGGHSDTIRKIVIATGVVTTLAGSAGSTGWADGVGSAAKFWAPIGIATDGTNLFVVDAGNRVIRKVAISTATVTTSAGLAGSTNGIGAAARFSNPAGVTTDGVNLYLVDRSNNVIRKIEIATGAVTTLAGRAGRPSFVNGAGVAAGFNEPADITTDGDNLYVADTGNHVIRKIVIATGLVSTFAGTGVAGSVDVFRTAARFNSPNGITTDGANLYVSDTDNHTIRKISIGTGSVSTLAGAALNPGISVGFGTAARFYQPRGITTDGANLYVADERNNTIRKIVIETGEVTTLAGTAGLVGVDDGVGAAARFNGPAGIATDGIHLYVAEAGDRVRKIDIATATVMSLAGMPGQRGVVNATASAARFWQPWGVTTDGSKLFVVDFRGATVRVIQ